MTSVVARVVGDPVWSWLVLGFFWSREQRLERLRSTRVTLDVLGLGVFRGGRAALGVNSIRQLRRRLGWGLSTVLASFRARTRFFLCSACALQLVLLRLLPTESIIAVLTLNGSDFKKHLFTLVLASSLRSSMRARITSRSSSLAFRTTTSVFL